MTQCTILSPQWLHTALNLGGFDGNSDLRVKTTFSDVKNAISLENLNMAFLKSIIFKSRSQGHP